MLQPARKHRQSGPSRLKIDMDWEEAAAHVVKVPKPKAAPKKSAKKKKARRKPKP